MLTSTQARLICENRGIYFLLEDEIVANSLENNNPDLFEAFCAINRIAAGAETVTDAGNGCKG